MPAPAAVTWAINELALGANPAVFMYMAGPIAWPTSCSTSATKQRHWAPSPLNVVGPPPWCSQGGRRIRRPDRRPVDNGDGTWHLEGVKRFITNGDTDDMFENILHLVLARPEGRGPARRGLKTCSWSQFMFDQETGDLGDRNGVFVITPRTQDGTEGPPQRNSAWDCMVGRRWDGSSATSTNGIRLKCSKSSNTPECSWGTKATATPSTGYLERARVREDRIQGADLTQMMDKTAPRVTIIHHPDVRRALMVQKTYAGRSACTVSLYSRTPGSLRWLPWCPALTRRWPSASTICCRPRR